jgi:tripartite-type tricarboxylate transporter receptor subunit TctC
MQRRSFLQLATVPAAASLPWTSHCAAETTRYPTKPIRAIVPYAPGGSGEVVARSVGAKLTQLWGQPFLVEPKPGANGIIGTDYVAKAAPDGYTLLVATDIQFAINPALYAKLPYDPVRNFEPITQAAFIEFVLAVPASLNVKSLAELVAVAKANPGKLNFASTGTGSTHHLAMELLKHMAGFDANHVPYKGSGQALPDLVGGQVQMMYLGLGQTLPLIRAGKLRALAVGSAKRLPAAPDIPTIAETYPGFEANASWNYFAPAATPKDIVAKLNSEIVKIVRSPEIAQIFVNGGLEPVGSSAAELAARMASDRVKWTDLIRKLNLKLSE